MFSLQIFLLLLLCNGCLILIHVRKILVVFDIPCRGLSYVHLFRRISALSVSEYIRVKLACYCSLVYLYVHLNATYIFESSSRTTFLGWLVFTHRRHAWDVLHWRRICHCAFFTRIYFMYTLHLFPLLIFPRFYLSGIYKLKQNISQKASRPRKLLYFAIWRVGSWCKKFWFIQVFESVVGLLWKKLFSTTIL